jgi:Rrf2 family protein
MLHALLHMGESPRPLTSEELARQTRSNAAVMRRTMAGLREAGVVRSEKGHGGGWTLLRPLERISLADIYEALGAPAIFALGDRTERPRCLLEQAVNRAVQGALGEAESLLMARLRAVTLAEIAADAPRRHAGRAA